MIEQRPQLFLMMGDTVYGDVSSGKLTELKAAYAMQAQHQEFAAARARMPFLATWDDHDYGLNDASGVFPYKAASRDLFAAFWQMPAGALPAEGIYRSRIYGPPGQRVQIILLDLRTFRSAFTKNTMEERRANRALGTYKANADPKLTMQGEAQWRWLEGELRKPAEIRLIVSSTQVLAENHGWERWGQLPAERARLIDLVAKTGARGALFLSGDRHRGAIYRLTTGVPYPLHDITSSALNRSMYGTDPDDAGRITPMLSVDNFGLIEIDWAGRTLKAGLHTRDSATPVSVNLQFSDLGIP